MTPDPRTQRKREILLTIEEEPVTFDTAMELLGELAEIEASLDRNPPEFGSAEWYENLPMIDPQTGEEIHESL